MRGLGRGLEALLSSENSYERQITVVSVDEIVPRADQPRTSFEPEPLEELAASIKEHGLIQPILVRPKGDRYEIIAGERRWRAAKLAGVNELPAVVLAMDDTKAAEVSLIENLQREDLNVLEEARAYKQVMEKFHYTQELLAERVGKSRSYVANILRILTLPEEIQKLVEAKQISAGHARTLLALPRAEQLKAAERITKNKLSVRDLENLVKKSKERKSRTPKKPVDEYINLQESMENYFSAKVRIMPGKTGGKVEISYYNDEDLERIAEILGIDME
jgi:ParB family chromosome partitioning protein